MTDAPPLKELQDEELDDIQGSGMGQMPAGGWGKNVYVQEIPSGALTQTAPPDGPSSQIDFKKQT